MAGYVTEGQIIVCVAKGIEEDTLMTISDVTEQEIPCADVAVMCGCPTRKRLESDFRQPLWQEQKQKALQKNPGSVYE